MALLRLLTQKHSEIGVFFPFTEKLSFASNIFAPCSQNIYKIFVEVHIFICYTKTYQKTKGFENIEKNSTYDTYFDACAFLGSTGICR